MALLSLCRHLCSFRAFNGPIKISYTRIHSFNKPGNSSFLKRSNSVLTSKRNHFWIFRHKRNKEIRSKDNVPDYYQMIYRNGIDHYFLVAQVFTFFSAIIVAIVTIALSDDPRPKSIAFSENNYWKAKPRHRDEELLVFTAAFMLVCIMFSFYMARTPMRIYYNRQKNNYVLVFYGMQPFSTKSRVIGTGELRHIPGSDIVPWNENRYQHDDGRKLILMMNYFRRPADLYIMMGLQKDPYADMEEKQQDKQEEKR